MYITIQCTHNDPLAIYLVIFKLGTWNVTYYCIANIWEILFSKWGSDGEREIDILKKLMIKFSCNGQTIYQCYDSHMSIEHCKITALQEAVIFLIFNCSPEHSY